MNNGLYEKELKKRNEHINEFRKLCKPLNEWLRKNYHPHAKIIIDCESAEVVDGAMRAEFEVKD